MSISLIGYAIIAVIVFTVLLCRRFGKCSIFVALCWPMVLVGFTIGGSALLLGFLHDVIHGFRRPE